MARLMKGEVKIAIQTLRRNKARSLLTMLGIIIGVASVVLIMGIGEGIKHQVSDQTDRLGKDLITIRPGQLLTQTAPGPFGGLDQLVHLSANGVLDDRDLDTALKTPGVANAVPLSIVNSGVISGENGRHYDALVIGTNAGFPEMLRQNIAYGMFFDSSSSAINKVVIGTKVAQALYDENVPLGQTLSILGHQFIVVGIFDEFQSAPLTIDSDFNNAVFIPYTSAQQITDGNSPIYQILARPSQITQTGAVVSRLNGSLLAAHGGQHDFTVLEQSKTLLVTDSILSLLTALVAAVAGISLLVGGIGIMNVMLVSVTERMHEVGIRKAIGATNRQILRQFMVEAAVLSIAGGVIGVLLALIVELILRIFTSFAPVTTWQVIVAACAVSITVGILFGSVPALKAARKDPISALRNE